MYEILNLGILHSKVSAATAIPPGIPYSDSWHPAVHDRPPTHLPENTDLASLD